MTMAGGRLDAAGPAARGPDSLVWLDQVRSFAERYRLTIDPIRFGVLWRYVRDEDHDLSLAIDTAIAHGDLDDAALLRLAAAQEPDRGEVNALVAAARQQAEALTGRIEAGRTDLADYGRAIADGGARLANPLDATGLAALLADLGQATAAMEVANRRLQAELETAASDTRALAARLRQAERAAITDALTGVLNRRGTFAALEQALLSARGTGRPLAIAMVDIDHFKRFNDRFGHALGDEVLRFVAAHLTALAEPLGGEVGRLGGEEFIVLLPGLELPAAAARIDAGRAALTGQVLRNAGDGSSMGRIGFSAGVAAPHDDDSADTLVARADRALYTAKRMGRDRVVPDRG